MSQAVRSADKAVEALMCRYGSIDKMPPDAQTLVLYYLSVRRGLEREAHRILSEVGRFL